MAETRRDEMEEGGEPAVEDVIETGSCGVDKTKVTETTRKKREKVKNESMPKRRSERNLKVRKESMPKMKSERNLKVPDMKKGTRENKRKKPAAKNRDGPTVSTPVLNQPTIMSLEQVITMLKQGTANVKGVKRLKNADFVEILKSLEVHCEKGFNDNVIVALWSAAIHPKLKLNLTQRRNLIWMLVPEFIVPNKLVLAILNWLRGDHAKIFTPMVATGILQLLNLYAECAMLDSSIPDEQMMAAVLNISKKPFTIPWKVNLFWNVAVTPSLRASHIKALKTLLKTPNRKKVHAGDVYAVLGKCKYVKSELFQENETFMHSIRVLKYPNVLRERFHKAKVRIQEGGPESHPLAMKIFPEHLPHRIETGSGSLLMTMLTTLTKRHGAFEIAKSDVLLPVFANWVEPILYYRLHPFGNCSMEGDEERSLLIMKTILKIQDLRPDDVKTFSDWVRDILIVFGQSSGMLLSNFLETFLCCLTPAFVEENLKLFEDHFTSEFEVISSRAQRWKVIQQLMRKWILGWGTTEQGSAERLVYDRMLCWLAGMINHLTANHIRDLGPGSDDDMTEDIALACDMFGKLLDSYGSSDAPQLVRDKINETTVMIEVVRSVNEEFPISQDRNLLKLLEEGRSNELTDFELDQLKFIFHSEEEDGLRVMEA